MKKIVVILGSIAILCILFVVGVNIVEHKQTDVIKLDKDSVTLEQLEKVYGKPTVFSEILQKDTFGEVQEINQKMRESKDAKFSDTEYFYKDTDWITEVIDIFGTYEYYTSNIDPDEDAVPFWDMIFVGTEENVLRSVAYPVEGNTDIISVYFFCENMGGVVQDDWKRLVVCMDSSVVDDIYACMEAHIQEMTLELAKSLTESAESKLDLTTFLGYKHEYEETKSEGNESDCYTIFRQELSDTEKYLKIYAVITKYSGTQGTGRRFYIFKVELYDGQGELEQELYSDMESYNSME